MRCKRTNGDVTGLAVPAGQGEAQHRDAERDCRQNSDAKTVTTLRLCSGQAITIAIQHCTQKASTVTWDENDGCLQSAALNILDRRRACK